MKQQLRYSTWIRTRKIVALWIVAGAFFVSALLALITPWFLLLVLPGLVFAYTGLVVTWTYARFSSRGGNYQNKIHDLILSYRQSQGETLDIGCGNGNLIIKVATSDKTATHLGLDYWGKDWEYSIEQCRINARIEGVDNIDFVKASAARTGLPDNKYRNVISCLTFHEVRDESNKASVVSEALRMLRPGGTYVFLDLFDDKKYFGNIEDVASAIAGRGCTVMVNKSIRELMKLPYPLNGKKALRYARLISGTKSASG
jgi:ubiquinone/menaquinone biosynthesis C-methylase UbiE